MDFGALDQYSRVQRLAAEMARAGVGRATVDAWLADMPDLCGKAALDLGCGEGAALEALTRAVGLAGRAVGVDPCGALLQRGSARTALGERLHCVQACAEALPFPDQSFDLCWCDRVLSHVGEYRSALSEMVRVLRPGGRMLITVFDYSALRWCGVVGVRLEALLQAYIRSVRQPALSSVLVSELRSLGLRIDVEVRDHYLLTGRREILRGTAALHWLRQALDRGSLAAADLLGAATEWRVQCADAHARVQVEMLTLLASRPQ